MLAPRPPLSLKALASALTNPTNTNSRVYFADFSPQLKPQLVAWHASVYLHRSISCKWWISGHNNGFYPSKKALPCASLAGSDDTRCDMAEGAECRRVWVRRPWPAPPLWGRPTPRYTPSACRLWFIFPSAWNTTLIQGLSGYVFCNAPIRFNNRGERFAFCTHWR